MKNNAGLRNLKDLNISKITDGAAFKQNDVIVKKAGKKKGFLIYPHEALLEVMRDAKKKGKLTGSIGLYFIGAAKEKLEKEGFEQELKEKGLL